MSTRSQLQFVDEWDWEDKDGKSHKRKSVAQIYRHSDGYPSSVIYDLKKLQDFLKKTTAHRDASYLAAQFIFWDKLDTLRCLYLKDGKTLEEIIDNASENQPYFMLGHGVEGEIDAIHGDEEYLYIVDVSHNDVDCKNDWYIKISEHGIFPRWDDEKVNIAFKEAKWQFEGSLADAYQKFVVEKDEE